MAKVLFKRFIDAATGRFTTAEDAAKRPGATVATTAGGNRLDRGTRLRLTDALARSRRMLPAQRADLLEREIASLLTNSD